MSSSEEQKKQNKHDSIEAVNSSIKALEDLIKELMNLKAAVGASHSAVLQVARRLQDAANELYDQQMLVAHLRAASVQVQPMSKEARSILKRALLRLDQFVKADQNFHTRLEKAELVVGFINDHETEIRELTTEV